MGVSGGCQRGRGRVDWMTQSMINFTREIYFSYLFFLKKKSKYLDLRNTGECFVEMFSFIIPNTSYGRFSTSQQVKSQCKCMVILSLDATLHKEPKSKMHLLAYFIFIYIEREMIYQLPYPSS